MLIFRFDRHFEELHITSKYLTLCRPLDFERLSRFCYVALSKEGILRDQTVAATETIILWCYNETVRVLNYFTKKPGLNLYWYLKILFINSIESGRWCEEERKTRSVRLCASPIKYAQQEVSADVSQILYNLIAAGLRDLEISRFLSFFASLSWSKKSYRNSLPTSSFCLSYFSWGGLFPLKTRLVHRKMNRVFYKSRSPFRKYGVCNAC